MPFSIRPICRSPLQCSVTKNVSRSLKLLVAYCSGFWLLLIFLVLSSGPVYAEWMAVEQLAGIMTVYVDPDTIHRKGNLVTMWQLIDFTTMQGGRSPSRFSSTKIQKQFDCAEDHLRLLALTDFWGNMGTGEATGATIGGGHWIPIERESLNHALWEVACNTP